MSVHPSPREVPGFESARVAGLLPTVPEQPPAPVVMSSNKVTMWMIAAFVVGMGMLVISDMQGPLFVLALVFIPAVLIAGTQAPAALRTREHAAGYCRSHDWVGMPPLMIGKQNGAGPAGCQWNGRGLWLLDANDEATERPDPSVLPPGMYPCTQNGDWDLWTGAQWLGRPRPAPHLTGGPR